MEIRVFSKLVNKSLVAEECLRKAVVERGSQRMPFQRAQGRNFAPRGRNFKRGGFAPQHNQGQNSFRMQNNTVNQGRRFCVSPDQDSIEPQLENALQIPRSCLEKKYETGRVQQPGRVFTTSAAGAEGSEILIRGNCEVAGKLLNALFDSGATHSFIAFEKASELRLKIVVLDYDLKVHNATSKAVVTRLGYWLSKNRVLLNCSERTLHFMSEGSEGPVVAKDYYLNSVVVNCSGCECAGVVLLAANVSGEEQTLEQIPVVCEFPEVFSDDILEFPPAREIEFAI
ncbi:uncharacterized protein LOC107636693 [Arachis ipaensis]|uniref:uncharacterized protein LOC107636693 n=1 Tax=Arachis ipaensis TaxID=130454 RepID=UPI0007AF6AA2|nr:uncharacterized protein LOC107636693 [Arachis ipaensis]XP_025647862.1 uncharacterized protein LOC112742839 [Arachis hypogaea]